MIIKPGGGTKINNTKFVYNNKEITITNQYKYLGIIINTKGNFALAKEDLKNKGLKAMFAMWSSISPGKIPPVNLATKLFDAMIKPIITYNSDVWGSESPPTIHKLVIKGDLMQKQQKTYAVQ